MAMPETPPARPLSDGDSNRGGSPWGFLFELGAPRGEAEEPPAREAEPEPAGKPSRRLHHQTVPRNTDLLQEFGAKAELQEITTLMIRNIPNLYTRKMLMEELDSLDLRNQYDFIYLPIDKSTQWNVGYAFVNFTSPDAATRCTEALHEYSFCKFALDVGKVAWVCPAHIQGLERNLQYYSKTAVHAARIPSHRPLALEGPAATAGPHPRRRRRRRGRRQEAAALVNSDGSPVPNCLDEEGGDEQEADDPRGWKGNESYVGTNHANPVAECKIVDGEPGALGKARGCFIPWLGWPERGRLHDQTLTVTPRYGAWVDG